MKPKGSQFEQMQLFNSEPGQPESEPTPAPSPARPGPGQEGFQYPMLLQAKQMIGNVGGEWQDRMARFNPGDLTSRETMSGDYSDLPSGEWLESSRQETVHEGWDRKLDEAHDRGLHDSISYGSTYEDDYDGSSSSGGRGIRNPVLLYDNPENNPKTGVVMNGHHRLVAAYDADPDMEVPVSYGKYRGGDDYQHALRRAVEGERLY